MDLLSIIRAVWRHKIAAVPVILLTALGAYYIIAIKPPVYEASSNILLLSPPNPPTASQISADPRLAKVNTNNPYVNFGNLGIVADAVLNVLSASSTQQALARVGVDPQYQVTVSTDSSNPPILQITGVGPSAEVAIRSAQLVTETATTDLYEMQKEQHVDGLYMIKATELVQPDRAQLSASGKLRSLIAVLGLGALLLFVLVSVADAMDKRRVDSSISDGTLSRGSQDRRRRRRSAQISRQDLRTPEDVNISRQQPIPTMEPQRYGASSGRLQQPEPWPSEPIS